MHVLQSALSLKGILIHSDVVFVNS
uniref:Uncharacterized protein n=1 Tax=Vitis vinifera TaxID=29760 RepID=F6H2P7_VITVI